MSSGAPSASGASGDSSKGAALGSPSISSGLLGGFMAAVGILGGAAHVLA